MPENKILFANVYFDYPFTKYYSYKTTITDLKKHDKIHVEVYDYTKDAYFLEYTTNESDQKRATKKILYKK